MRNNEIGALIGLNQLKRLDYNINKRKDNFEFFLKNICPKNFYTNYDVSGNSNYAFPIILKEKNIKKRDYFEKILDKNLIEYRRGNAGGGNQLRQPFVKNSVAKINLNKFPNVEHVHFFGYYIGNFPSLSRSKILKICKILNLIKKYKS
tara:strand:- start:29 stop:475 length:447 start_codon:yes stop_codon:yes gene_type:complete